MKEMCTALQLQGEGYIKVVCALRPRPRWVCFVLVVIAPHASRNARFPPSPPLCVWIRPPGRRLCRTGQVAGSDVYADHRSYPVRSPPSIFYDTLFETKCRTNHVMSSGGGMAGVTAAVRALDCFYAQVL
jgi:hypothetical protein